MNQLAVAPTRRFHLFLIKPSHYDDDGYVIQWLRSGMPSNSLATVYGLAREASASGRLGPGISVEIHAIDETNTRVDTRAIVAAMREAGGFGLVGIVGVQSNEFPRAVDIARPLRAAGIPVVIGGFHVSGCLSMLPTMPADIVEALDLGITLFAGEAEGRLADLLADAVAGDLRPIYNFMDDLPDLATATAPFLPHSFVEKVIGNVTSFDAGRGCPFQCSFCTIINVQGRVSRRRTPDGVEAIIRANLAEGINRFFITDDNFARNKDWEPILDRIIALREGENLDLGFMLQVDTLCHRIPNFVEKAKRAGVTRVFIGLENINPANLLAAKKRQNKITEYRQMLLAWKKAGIMTLAGYILGFPDDTPQSILRDIDIIKRELPLDILEFFILTPLPGSEDHKVLVERGEWIDPDLNKYELEHVVARHPRMTPAEWQGIYWQAWRHYYTPDHVLRIFRRALRSGIKLSSLWILVLWFQAAVRIDGVHPIQAGLVRLKRRTDRRPGLPIEPAWRFYPRYVAETAWNHGRLAAMFFRVGASALRALATRNRPYDDPAMNPVAEDDTERLEMFTQSDAARTAVQHVRKVASLTAGGGA